MNGLMLHLLLCRLTAGTTFEAIVERQTHRPITKV
jgi:hypothetical protein